MWWTPRPVAAGKIFLKKIPDLRGQAGELL